MTKDQNYVQTFGKKKNATAVALLRPGKGVLRVNGKPIDLVEPKQLRVKLMEPILLLGQEEFAGYDIRLRVRGGGYISQLYAVRLALCKALIAYQQKFVDEQSKRRVKEILLQYDRSLLVADMRRREPKHIGGRGARSKKQKSYR